MLILMEGLVIQCHTAWNPDASFPPGAEDRLVGVQHDLGDRVHCVDSVFRTQPKSHVDGCPRMFDHSKFDLDHTLCRFALPVGKRHRSKDGETFPLIIACESWTTERNQVILLARPDAPTCILAWEVRFELASLPLRPDILAYNLRVRFRWLKYGCRAVSTVFTRICSTANTRCSSRVTAPPW